MFEKFLVGVILCAMPSVALAQNGTAPAAAPAQFCRQAPPIPGSVWVGAYLNERRLELQLKEDGTAIKIDQHGVTRGRWTVQDDRVTMTFGSYVIVGKVDGMTLNGVCQLNGGPLPLAWEFRTRYESRSPGSRR